MNENITFHQNHDSEMGQYQYTNILRAMILWPMKFRRNKHLWVFGCWDGKRYDDNAKSFFEYIAANHLNITPVWISRRNDIVDDLKEKGYRAVLAGTEEAKRILTHAGVVFFTNSLYDIDTLNYISGAVVVNLCHGSGGAKDVKLIPNRFKRFTPQYYLKEALTYVNHHVWGWFYFNYIVTPSLFCSKIKKDVFSLKNTDGVIPVGFPRNDIFFNGVDYRQKLGFDQTYKYILYMPTYRNYENSVIQDFVDNVLSNTKLMEALRVHKYKILIKPHNSEKSVTCCENEVLAVLKPNQISDTQELIAMADILITDYSSAITDFALKGNTSIFYAPDIKEYIDKSGLTKYWKSLLEIYGITDINYLAEKICEIVKSGEPEPALTEAINRNYQGEPLAPGDSYCSRLYDYLQEELF